ncbi:MAG: hypothetical protein H6613_13145 [Ignavibacteriales bacterium]|nr:hypothetical protein [Ignavibacteriales bacterium]
MINLYAQTLFADKNSGNVNPNDILASVDTINITAEEFFYNYEFGPAFTKREKKIKRNALKFYDKRKTISIRRL